MTFISSFKPTDEAMPRQVSAFQSWNEVASQIVYFNSPCVALTSPKTTFVESEVFPSIWKIAALAGWAPEYEWVCILNADIVITANLLNVVEKLNARKVTAASSWRYQFDPAKGISSAEKPTDMGLDFFMALPEVWRGMAGKIPKDLTIGAPLWDTWMLSYFATFCCEHYADITPAKVVLHPIHSARNYGPTPKTPELYSWPVQSPLKIS